MSIVFRKCFKRRVFPQWAFGVTLWELMTLGQTPYVDIDPFEMSAYLKDGYRIAQPINCPDELYVTERTHTDTNTTFSDYSLTGEKTAA